LWWKGNDVSTMNTTHAQAEPALYLSKYGKRKT